MGERMVPGTSLVIPQAIRDQWRSAKRSLNRSGRLLSCSHLAMWLGAAMFHLKRGQAGAAAAAAATEVRRPQPRGRVMKAPDISSEVYFPSLGNSEDTAPKGAWGKNPGRVVEGAFEEVKGGDKQASVRSTESKALTLGNKFDVLGAE